MYIVDKTLEEAIDEAFADGIEDFANNLVYVQEYVHKLEDKLASIKELVDGPY